MHPACWAWRSAPAPAFVTTASPHVSSRSWPPMLANAGDELQDGRAGLGSEDLVRRHRHELAQATEPPRQRAVFVDHALRVSSAILTRARACHKPASRTAGSPLGEAGSGRNLSTPRRQLCKLRRNKAARAQPMPVFVARQTRGLAILLKLDLPPRPGQGDRIMRGVAVVARLIEYITPLGGERFTRRGRRGASAV